MQENEKKRVLITDDCHQLLIDRLGSLGYQVEFQPDITYEKVLAVISDYSGLIINSKVLVNRQFLDCAVRLEWVGRLGSGMEIVDRAYAARKGVHIFGSPEGNCNAVAEHAFGMLLCLSNQLLKADREVRKFIWQREARRGWELAGKTIGIIGFGTTGRAFAEKWSGWQAQVIAYDKYLPPGYASALGHVREVDLETLLRESDIISFHLPLTPETRYYAQEELYSITKPGVILVNTSRGQVLHTPSLVAALESGRVGGACLDVFENEKPHTYTAAEKKLYRRLNKMEQVVLTPHIAGWTHESKQKMAEILAQKIAQVAF